MMWFWLVMGLVLLAAEVHTNAFYAVFFAIGAFAATVAALVNLDPLLQIMVAAGFALAGAALARPVLVRYLDQRHPDRALPGIPSLIGQGALTVDEVGDDHHPGHVLLAGERWLAVTDAPAPLAGQRNVIVIAVRGTTLLVRPSS